jgi:hypothetical protein
VSSSNTPHGQHSILPYRLRSSNPVAPSPSVEIRVPIRNARFATPKTTGSGTTPKPSVHKPLVEIRIPFQTKRSITPLENPHKTDEDVAREQSTQGKRKVEDVANKADDYEER